jgi:hypothetical protein
MIVSSPHHKASIEQHPAQANESLEEVLAVQEAPYGPRHGDNYANTWKSTAGSPLDALGWAAQRSIVPRARPSCIACPPMSLCSRVVQTSPQVMRDVQAKLKAAHEPITKLESLTPSSATSLPRLEVVELVVRGLRSSGQSTVVDARFYQHGVEPMDVKAKLCSGLSRRCTMQGTRGEGIKVYAEQCDLWSLGHGDRRQGSELLLAY